MDNRKKVFDQIKKLIKKYEPPFHARSDFDSRYELWSEKEIKIGERKKKGVCFAGLVIQSHYVGFYYMPVYTNTAVKKLLKRELLSSLKGKSCFHIKKLDKAMIAQIRGALKIGYDMYKAKGWV